MALQKSNFCSCCVQLGSLRQQVAPRFDESHPWQFTYEKMAWMWVAPFPSASWVAKTGILLNKKTCVFFEFATISLQDKDASGCSFSLMPLDVPPPRVMVLHHTEKLTFLAIRVDVLDLLGTSLYLWRSVLAAVCAHLSLGWKYPPSTDSFQLHSVASLIGLSIYVLIYLILSRPDWSCSFSFFRWQSMTRLALQWASQSPSSKLLMSWRPGANMFSLLLCQLLLHWWTIGVLTHLSQ